jgi:hypothetical protein
MLEIFLSQARAAEKPDQSKGVGGYKQATPLGLPPASLVVLSRRAGWSLNSAEVS